LLVMMNALLASRTVAKLGRRRLSSATARWDGSGRWEDSNDDFMIPEQYGKCE
jgi:hypothetical protein